MNLLTAQQIDDLLAAAGTGAAVYLVGAGGCGMSGLGHLLLDLGFQVAGSDLQINQEIFQLRDRGACIHHGHEAAQLETARPLLVVYSAAVRTDNPELRRARELNIPVARRAQVLAALLHRQRGVCVAGMHGKTTTSAMLAFALDQLGATLSYAVGWRVPQLGRHARYVTPAQSSTVPWFVIEADESDGSLREYHPRHALVLNVDEEHLDYFADGDAISREFRDFGVQTEQTVVFCADDERLAGLFSRHPHAVSFGYHPLAAYRIETKLSPAGGHGPITAAPTCFEIWHDHRRLGEFTLGLLGEKNISNAAAVIAWLHQAGYSAADIAPALAAFRGAARRQEELYRDAHYAVFDDYGHHPTEICATLRALRSLSPRRLLVAFQPHRYTRTQHLLKEFAACFAGADRLWLMEIYPASEREIPGINSSLLAREISAQGQRVEVVADLIKLQQRIRAAMRPGDLVLFLGAGADITVVARRLAAQLRADCLARRTEAELATLTEIIKEHAPDSYDRESEFETCKV